MLYVVEKEENLVGRLIFLKLNTTILGVALRIGILKYQAES